MNKTSLIRWCLSLFLCQFFQPATSQGLILHDQDLRTVRVQDEQGTLVLKIDYSNKCVIDYVETLGKSVITNSQGAYSSVKSEGTWFTTLNGIPSPEVKSENNRLIIENIIFGGKNKVTEKWIFNLFPGYIDWTIERSYQGNMSFEDTGFPQWSFDSMSTWTGALPGTGGVAWSRLFDEPDASLGNHTGEVTFWNEENKSCLRIDPVVYGGNNIAVRFSRQPDNKFTLNYTVSEEKLRTKHYLSRFVINRQDIWDSFDARGTVKVTYRLSAMNYDTAYYRGEFPGLNGESIRSLLNTIARVGVIDENLMGSNNWHIGMGYVCLHENWVAQMGLAINDQNYLMNYRKSLDYFRDNAISPEGNVKDRWGYRIWDSEPGTFDNGFYECQWGDLLDANTDYVTNVAGLFQMNGDLKWAMSHKQQCEKALDCLLGRDSDDDGLIEVLTNSYKEKKGSDWIDVIWASWENAFINAKLYEAMTQWAEIEELTGDVAKAEYYRSKALKCKNRFNQPVNEGGFWNPVNSWYVYWRDKDDTIHGDNLVTPVNFMAIAYGICDDSSRQEAILSKIESLMLKEKLFIWPISFFPYKPDEGKDVNYPFPNYENGDIFLAWGELGIRAYQNYDPSIPVKYIKNVLKQYEKDGLAFQRYDRIKQSGQGDDILANNCLPVVGLYQDIYGVQPRHNRLYLDPHLTEELNGTKLKYWMRGQYYNILLSKNSYSMNSNSYTLSSSDRFGMYTEENILHYFNSNYHSPSLVVSRDKPAEIRIQIIKWDSGKNEAKKWIVSYGADPVKTDFEISLSEVLSGYKILKNGLPFTTQKSDKNGKIRFSSHSGSVNNDLFEVIPAD